MEIITMYRASDGAEFETKTDCLAYEEHCRRYRNRYKYAVEVDGEVDLESAEMFVTGYSTNRFSAMGMDAAEWYLPDHEPKEEDDAEARDYYAKQWPKIFHIWRNDGSDEYLGKVEVRIHYSPTPMSVRALLERRRDRDGNW